jgi:phosphoadenosine phosphosulfate reductase
MKTMTTAVQRHARKTRGFEARVAHAAALLREAAEDHAGHIVQATSLGVEGMVLTDLIARHGLAIEVATLNTGKLHRETVALIPRIRQRYGLQVAVFHPRHEAVVQFVGRHGADAMFESVDLRRSCCELRKVEPMQRLLLGRSAWITGLRREQSETRAGVPFFELDANGREKFYPLADWSEADVWHYVATHDVPYSELHDRFFASVGCEPCTRAVSMGEDPRAGRWWWEQGAARECGLHLPRPRATAAHPA